MYIDSIRLHQFRNYEELLIEPDQGINLFYGQNGSGKTNILEAIHYCSLGKSHRTNNDRDVIREGEDFALCEIRIRNAHHKETIKMRLSKTEKKIKQFYLSDKKITKYSELMGQLPCVIFSPEDLLVIKESPQLRRKLIDMMISQISTTYFVALQSFNHILEQRNTLLRESKISNQLDEHLIDSFDEQLSKSGSVIINLRYEFIKKMSQYAERFYQEICQKESEHLSIQYKPCIQTEECSESDYLTMLLNSRSNDIYRGTTERGVQREDIKISLNQKDIKIYGSQGQIRTAALCMKLAQIYLFYETTSEYPILLLDDVMSELDENRRNQLLGLSKNIQTFITCTEDTIIDNSVINKKYFVINQAGIASSTVTYQCNSKDEFVQKDDLSLFDL